MARIYLIRHAESVANARGIFQGRTYDTDLSPLGLLQTQALKNRFISEKFDAIYASPLKRTLQTAKPLNHITIEPSLIETNHGQWEGLSKAEIKAKWPKVYDKWLTHPGQVVFPDGEHFSQTVERISRWFDKVSQTTGTYVAVTHSNVIMVLITKIMGLNVNDMWQFAMQPTAVTLIESQSPAKIIYLNDTSHLKGLESDLTTQAI